MKLRISLPAALLLAGWVAQAQTLSTEITVDRTVAPQQTAVSPLPSVQPTLLTASPLSGDLTLSDFGGDAPFAAHPDSVMPFLYDALPGKSPYRGYASLGYFPTYRIGAQAGYNIIDSENTLLLVSARFGGMSWHSDGGANTGGRTSVSDNNFAVNANWLQRIGAHRLKAYAEFSGAYTENPTMTGLSGNQNYTGARAGLSLQRHAERFGYGLKMDFDHFGASKALHTTFGRGSDFEAAANTVFGAQLWGRLGTGALAAELSAGVTAVSRKGGAVYSVLEDWGYGHWGPGLAASDAGSHSNTVGTFRLAATHSSDHIDLRLGVRADIAGGYKPDRLNIAPDVEAVWHPSEVTRVYMTAGGRTAFNTLRERFDRTPFAPAWNVNRLERVPFRATAGFGYDPGRGFRAGFEAGFQRTIGGAMMLVYSTTNIAIADERTVTYTPLNLKGAWFEGRVGYSLPSFYGLDLNLGLRRNINRKPTLMPESTNIYDEEWGLPENPDRADWVINFAASANPTDRLTVGLGWNLRSGRHVYYDDHRDGLNYTLGSVNNLSINGEYRLNERLSLGLRLDNLLGHRYFLIPGVQSSSVTGLVGATYRF